MAIKGATIKKYVQNNKAVVLYRKVTAIVSVTLARTLQKHNYAEMISHNFYREGINSVWFYVGQQ